jgi:nitric oxide reductase NorQ protein
MLVISYNPGYQNLLKGLKPSTRQRFVALTMGYPTAEIELTIVQTEAGVSKQHAEQLVRLAKALRGLTEHDLEETVSTRLLVSAGRLIASGVSMQVACHAAIIDALTDDAVTAQALGEVVRALVGDAS